MRKYTKNTLKKQLTKLVSQIQVLTDTKTKLTPEQDKTFLVNEFVMDELKRALSLVDTDFTKCCELICNIPSHIVNPGPHATKKYKYVGSGEIYAATDSMRHTVRMLPDSAFKSKPPKNATNNMLFLRA